MSVHCRNPLPTSPTLLPSSTISDALAHLLPLPSMFVVAVVPRFPSFRPGPAQRRGSYNYHKRSAGARGARYAWLAARPRSGPADGSMHQPSVGRWGNAGHRVD